MMRADKSLPSRPSLWGVGPRILVTAAGYAVAAGVATYLWPDATLIQAVPYWVFVTVGIAFLLVGIPMLIVAGRAATVAYSQNSLATTGIFGLTRNPIYSAWIVFIIPGLVMFSRSWPLLLTPIVAYVVFKISIRRESEYLEERFGEEYRQYRARVNELVPWPRR
jgi:protein-S-isoprenylcysteine O-methyltransferase Ste14